MKKIIIIISIFLLSCNKENRPENVIITPSYVGVYNSNAGDTSYVSVTDNYATIRWAALSGNTITFDSVLVATDLTFTNNEYVDFGGLRHSLGTGDFIPSNTMYFKFVLDNNATIIFNGIKQ
jgi:hypothetical protein